MTRTRRFISEKLESLYVRILGGIFVVFFLTVVMIMYGVWTYQRDKLITLRSQNAIQLSDVIVAGLRSSMLQNDREATMRSIDSILHAAGSERISVINAESRVRMTSDPELMGKVYNKKTDPSCRGCHAVRSKTGRNDIVRIEGEKYINTVTPIQVEPACFGCHDKDQKIIGVLVVESSFRDTEEMLRDMAMRIGLTGILTFLFGVILLNYIVSRFLTRPLEILQEGFDRVGHGDFDHWVDVKSGGEIGYMADSFNVMSRAISRYVNEIREKTGEIGAHYDIVNDLSQTIDRKKLKEVVAELLFRILKADTVTLALSVDNHPKVFEIVQIRRDDNRHYHTYFDLDSGEMPDIEGITREDFMQWASGETQTNSYANNGLKLTIPLTHKNMSLGLVLVTRPEGQAFANGDRKIVPVLAHHISLSFANAQLYSIAITDGLTTLFTKRHFEKKINDYFHNFHATKRGFCLLMLDLDHFKEVNDKYGHPVGDKVLVKTADLIRSTIRHGDLPFRYGGEEFAVLMKGDDIETAVRTAERVRQSMEKNPFDIEGIEPFTKTVSIGVACFPRHFSTSEELINAADKALYKAKSSGRNKVVVYCRSTYGETDCD